MKRIVILGAGEGGVGTAVLTKKEGFDVFVSDMSAIKDKYKKMLDGRGIEWEEGQHTEEKILNAGEIIKSPGIPKEAPIVQKLITQGTHIINEIEFVGQYTNSKMIRIIGSSGKTTTTSLIYHIFKDAGHDAGLADNIGDSLVLQVAEDLHEYYIIELNSFQLDNMYDFRANIAILLNITPDYLDRYDHKFENYADAKMRIVQDQTKEGNFIHWNDDPVIKKELEKFDVHVVRYPFSELKENGSIGYIGEGQYTIEQPESFNMEQEDLSLTGRHNVHNSLVAGAASDISGIKKESIHKSLSDFPGVEHRLEKVCRAAGVQYINDSETTNIDVCWCALKSMRTPAILIIGGRDKGNDYNNIRGLVKQKYVGIVYLGADNKRLHDNFDDLGLPIHDTHSMKDCVVACAELAKPGDTVLLSPCYASFDLFEDMEDRGKQFESYVRALQGKTNQVNWANKANKANWTNKSHKEQKTMKNKSLSNIFKGDKVIWMVFFFLCIISIIEVYSASSSLSYIGGNCWSPIVYHCSILIVGITLMVVVLNIKCRYFKLIAPIVLDMSILLLAWVLAAGQSTNGASRWAGFAGIQFQPSELAKGALVLAIAQILSAMQVERGVDRKASKYIMWLSGGIILLILGENLSTAMLIGLTVILMVSVGRVPFNQLGRLTGFIVLLGIFILFTMMLVGDDKKAEDELSAKQNLIEQMVAVQQEGSPGFFDKILHRVDTWKACVKKFFSNEHVAPKDYNLDKDAQVARANITTASSDVVGKGPGNPNERDFLSQAFSDFIYAIIIGEMGIGGVIFIVFLYIILLFRTGIIANRCESSFPAFLAVGIAFFLVTQALFNMLVAVGLAPVTGQPLPLISKDGTSTIINCVYIGVILSVSRSTKKKKEEKKPSEKISHAIV